MTNPSAWTHRVWIVLCCLLGSGIAGYLTAVQLHWMAAAWDPIFGSGSEKVLFSAFSKALPIPDASLGLLAYVSEGILTCIGDRRRWQSRPKVVLFSGLIIVSAGLGSLGLILAQLLLIHHGCLLCLLSATISLGVCALAVPEMRLAWLNYRSEPVVSK